MKRVVLYDCGRLMARAKSATPTGIDRVDLRYLDHFLNDPDTQVIGVGQKSDSLGLYSEADVATIHRLLCRRWLDRAALSDADRRTVTRVYLRGKAMSLGAKLGRRLTGARFPGALRRRLSGCGDMPVMYVNASHKGLTKEPLFSAMKAELGARLVFFVHDMIPVDFPQFVRPGHDEKHAVRMRIAARQGDMIVWNSIYSRDRFNAFAAREGIEPPPGVILHIGVEPHFRPLATAAPPAERPYFLIVGTVEPRKNLRVLLDAWEHLRTRGGPVPQLRVIGKRGWVTEANIGDAERAAALAPDVVELDRVDDDALMAQLSGACALLFPSFTEGWGMPLVEAAIMGIPAIAADIPAFHEAGQGCVLLIDPADPTAWADAVTAYAAPASKARAAALDGLARFVPPQWTAHFEGLEAALAAQNGKNAGK
ncbi:glycosyltransferase family 4 protein [Meridianimarinicoccus roseus]|uniref:glycosyltransferase family 4 protein n=1 Tax=Meridianimarinicoccus roseus TaxID=2072018 RepID=UPI001EE66153|nr:glycosyltransferase family 1 protein [Meridianimarinicoccus roseus]